LAARRKIDLHKTMFLLPSIITLSSIFCGFDSIRLSASSSGEDDFHRASILIIFAMFFDMIDGRVARLTRTQSAFGLQLDSLADVISFGAAPALLLYKASLYQRPTAGLIVAFIFTGAAACRLARFNVLSMGTDGTPRKPGKYIVGLVVPGAAGIVVSVVVANHAIGGDLLGPKYVWGMMTLTVLLSFLMVSTVKFRSFKDLKLNARSAALVLFVVASSAVVSIQLRPAFVLVWLLGCYVAIGIGEALVGIPERKRERAAAAALASRRGPPSE
jgi:CDP-diacylglycerol--serine O-phosphatidyltransferase